MFFFFFFFYDDIFVVVSVSVRVGMAVSVSVLCRCVAVSVSDVFLFFFLFFLFFRFFSFFCVPLSFRAKQMFRASRDSFSFCGSVCVCGHCFRAFLCSNNLLRFARDVIEI